MLVVRESSPVLGRVGHVAGALRTAFGQLQDYWRIALCRSVTVVLYNTREELRDYTGIEFNHTDLDNLAIHGTADLSPGHELCHLFTDLLYPGSRSDIILEGVSWLANMKYSSFYIDMNVAATGAHRGIAQFEDLRSCPRDRVGYTTASVARFYAHGKSVESFHRMLGGIVGTGAGINREVFDDWRKHLDRVRCAASILGPFARPRVGIGEDEFRNLEPRIRPFCHHYPHLAAIVRGYCRRYGIDESILNEADARLCSNKAYLLEPAFVAGAHMRAIKGSGTA